MKNKFYKLIWPNGGWVIIKNYKDHTLDYEDHVACSHNDVLPQVCCEGTFICGSKRGYRTSGSSFYFYEYIAMEPLNTKYVLEKHFVGLI